MCASRQVFSAARLGGRYAGLQSAHRRQGDNDAPGGRQRHGARGAEEGQGLANLHHPLLRRQHGGREIALAQRRHVDVLAAASRRVTDLQWPATVPGLGACASVPGHCARPASARRALAVPGLGACASSGRLPVLGSAHPQRKGRAETGPPPAQPPPRSAQPRPPRVRERARARASRLPSGRLHRRWSGRCVRERAHSRTYGWESLVVRHTTHS